jgi:hypothetical protein
MGLPRLGATSLRTAWIGALSIAFVLFGRGDLTFWFQSPDTISWKLYHRPGYILQNQIAHYIRSVTSESDTIYVAFAEAELYYLSGRRAAVPQFYFLHAQYSKSVFDSIIEAIEGGKPAVVLLVQEPPANQMSPHAFLQILQQGYVRDRVFSVGQDAPPIVAFRRRVMRRLADQSQVSQVGASIE